MNKYRTSPLEQSMTSICDTAMDLEITASWLGEGPYGSEEQTKAHLYKAAQKLRDAYMLLSQITGADPCRQNKI
jgi:hypothetical protein